MTHLGARSVRWAVVVSWLLALPAAATTLIVSPDHAALAERQIVLLASQVRNAANSHENGIDVSATENGVAVTVMDLPAAERFLRDVGKKYTGPQFAVVKTAALTFSISYSPEALKTYSVPNLRKDAASLENIILRLRTPLRGISILPAIDGAIVNSSVPTFDPAKALPDWLVVTPRGRGSWHIALPNDTEHYWTPARKVLAASGLDVMLREYLGEPRELSVDRGELGVRFTVIDPDRYGPFVEAVRNVFAHNPDFVLTERPGLYLQINPTTRKPEAKPNESVFGPYAWLMSEVMTLADPAADVTVAGSTVTMRAKDPAYNAERSAAVRKAFAGRTDIVISEQPDHSLIIKPAPAAPEAIAPDYLVKAVKARLVLLKIPHAVVTPRDAGQVSVRFANDADAAAFRRAPSDASLFAIHLVDETQAGEASAPSPDDKKIPMKTGGFVWVHPEALITGDMIADAKVETNDQTGQIVIAIAMTERGRQVFAAATEANVGRRLAVVINGVAVTAPTVREPILGGSVQITGSFTPEEARTLADAILAHRDDLPLHVTDSGAR